MGLAIALCRPCRHRQCVFYCQPVVRVGLPLNKPNNRPRQAGCEPWCCAGVVSALVLSEDCAEEPKHDLPLRSKMLKPTVDHLIANVIPAARDYYDAETALSAAFATANNDQTKCQAECEMAKRRAAEVALAIDGLADRVH